MADPLEEKMKKFVEDLKSALPTELVIKEEVDVPALQRALEAEIDTAFQRKYKAVEAELTNKIEGFDAATKTKMGEIREFQGRQQTQVQSLLTDLTAKQQQQQKLVQEIRDLAAQKKAEIANSQAALTTQISNLRNQMQLMNQQVEEMGTAFRARGQKAQIGNLLPSGRRQIQVTVKNLKWYSLDHVGLRFTLKSNPSQTALSDELKNQAGESIVQGQTEVSMKVEIPSQLQTHQIYAVELVLNQAVISNSLELPL